MPSAGEHASNGRAAHVLLAGEDAPPSPRLADADGAADGGDVGGVGGGPAPASRLRLYLMVAADFGLAFAWVAKFGVTTPYFAHVLRAGAVSSHLVWVLGPVSGLLTAPVVGALSDRCRSRVGRRRPFMAGGAAAAAAGMLLFAEAHALPARARVPVAVLAFAVLDFATNVVLFPSRALLGDLLPARQQHDAQSAAAVLASVAEIAAGGFLYALHRPLEHLRAVFGVAAAVLLATTAVSLAACRETPLPLAPPPPDIEMDFLDGGDTAAPGGAPSDAEGSDPGEDEGPDKAPAGAPAKQAGVVREVFALVRDAVVNFPRALVRVGVVYGLGWLCWFACLPYFSAWIGDDVMGGSSTAAAGSAAALKFQRGVNVFAGASMAKALLSMLFSAVYPSLLRVLGARGERLMFAVPFAVFGVALAVLANTRNQFAAAAVVVLAALPFVATQTIPIAIVVQRFPERLASNLGVLNLFCVFPQLIDTMYTGPLAARFTESAVMRCAAAWALVAAAVSFFVL